MSKKSVWSLKFTTASLVLIPAAVGINYIGKAFAELLKLPLWLDSIGTIIASILSGPIIGALSGAINNILYGFTNPISFVYAITSIAIGITIGVLAYNGWFNKFGSVVLAGLIAALVAAVVSTPLNIIYWGGQTGNIWGDGLFGILTANHAPQWIASFLDELVVDLPDKVATVLISFGIYKSLPKKLTVLYSNTEETQKLD